jgi:hypothetical protein
VPQFDAELWVSTQVLPHFVVLPTHERPHAPCEQTSPAAHFVPHAPQLFSSLDVIVQAPPHESCPAGQPASAPASTGVASTAGAGRSDEQPCAPVTPTSKPPASNGRMVSELKEKSDFVRIFERYAVRCRMSPTE